MDISSPAFYQRGRIPAKYTCDGEGVNPKLEMYDVPLGAKTLVLIMDDPDSPMGSWTHWVVFNMDANTKVIEVGEELKNCVVGLNTWGKNSYGGPCPGKGTHRYFFKLFALNSELDLKADAGKSEVVKAMEGKIIAEANLIGIYSREG